MVTNNHSKFIKGRRILDASLIDNELMNTWKINNFFFIKLDIEKATIKWIGFSVTIF